MPDDVAWMNKVDFCKEYGISARSVDLWVKSGKVERITDLDRRAYFRLREAPRPEAPPWAVELLEELRGLRAEVAALRAPDVTPPPPLLGSGVAEQPGDARNGVTQAAWWRRLRVLLLGEG